MCGFHEDFEDAPEVEERYRDEDHWTPEEEAEYNRYLDETEEDEDFDDDAERRQDEMLERQELEDFEQADEYFNHYDYNDSDLWNEW